VVVIGGGFGGLFATQALRRAPVEVVLIDRTGHHLFQPLLYQVATGILSEGQITRSLREEFAKQANARDLLGEVSEIDLAGRTVTSSALGSSTSTPYDSLIVAAGSAYSYFGHDEFTAEAPGLKSVDDALEIRARIFAAFERAEAAQDEMERRRHLTFAVIGGGPTGIEMAGQIRDLARRSLTGNFGAIDPADARVVLLEAAPSLLPTYGRRLSMRTVRALEQVGVEVHLDARVTGVDPHAVVYEHVGRVHRLEATTKVWAAGVAAGSLATTLADQAGVERNRAGQLILEPDCTLPGHPEVFVVGDLMSTPGVPGVAQLAIQSGRHAARTIRARLEGSTDLRPFVYRDKGSLATIARFRAVATVKGHAFSGLPAWLFWLGVHLWTVMGFGRRLSVALRWAFAFVANRRPERVSTQLQAQWPLITSDRELPRSNGSRDGSPVAPVESSTGAP
jgi:NADH dehydrogenase